MQRFSEQLAANCYIWSSSAPEIKQPARIWIEGFPHARTFELNDGRPKFILQNGTNDRVTLHGFTESGERISILGANAFPGSWQQKNVGGRTNDYTGDMLICGAAHYTEATPIRRIEFCSSRAAEVFGLNFWPAFGKIRYVNSRFDPSRKIPIVNPILISASDVENGRRFKILSKAQSLEGRPPWFSIDFIKSEISIRAALKELHAFRQLLSVLAGAPLDIEHIRIRPHGGIDIQMDAFYPYQEPKRSWGSGRAPTPCY